MNFAWPLAFVGLIGVIIPLLIHLLQRGYGHKVTIGTLRWLEADRKPRWRKLVATQAPLLALRLLLIVMAVFVLAEPYVKSWVTPTRANGWVLVHPNVSVEQLEQLSLPDAERHWLAPGFPHLQEARPTIRDHTLWSLLYEVDGLLAKNQSLHVVAPATINNFAAAKPKVGRKISWTIVKDQTSHNPENPVPQSIDIVYDTHQQSIARRVAKAIASWSAVGLIVSPTLRPVESDTKLSEWIVWLSDEEIPQESGKVIVTGQPLRDSLILDTDTHIVQTTRHKIIGWTRGFDEKNPAFHAATFPEHLLALFLQHDAYSPPADYELPLNQTNLDTTVRRNYGVKAAENRITWPLLMLLILFCLERLFSLWFERQTAIT